MFGRSGYGLTAILLAMLAAAMLVIPLTRWYLGMSAGTEDLQTKLMVQTIAKDKWDEIHAETFDDLAAALAANPSPWTEYVGDGNRWKIETTISEEGKYVNAACASGAAGATDRKCRKVSIQVTDTMTGMTQAVNLAKVDSEFFNSRMKALENNVSALTSQVNTMKSTYLTSNYFVRNGNPSKPFTLTYQNENASITMPAGKAIYANVLGVNVPLSGGGSGVIGIPDYSKAQNLGTPTSADFTEITYTMPNDGWFFYHYTSPNCDFPRNAYLKVNGVLLNVSRYFGSQGITEMDGILPVKKGDKISISAIWANIRSNDYGGSPFQGSVHRAWSAFFIPNRK